MEKLKEFTDRGWCLFPVNSTKRPYIEGWQTAEIPVENWSAWPDARVGLVLGERSGVVRLDADGAEAVAMAQELVDGVETAEFTTPSGGRGWLFQFSPLFPGSQKLWTGKGPHAELRIQSTGAYTIIPPSAGYEWVREGPISPVPPKVVALALEQRALKLTQQLAPTVARPDAGEIADLVTHLTAAQADDRDTWFAVGCALHSVGDDKLLDAWIQFSKLSPKFQDGECEKLWASMRTSGGRGVGTLFWYAKEAGYTPPRRHHDTTDDGNGRTLAQACEDKARYCRDWDSWLWWDGRRWRNDRLLEVIHLFKELTRKRFEACLDSLRKYITDQSDEGKRKVKSLNRIFEWCKASKMAGRIKAAVDLARSEPTVLIEAATLDRKPWLLNCLNGTVNLHNGELRDHNRDDMLSQLCPTEYFPEAICPRWDKFLDEVFAGDVDLISWFQKLLGYGITGCTGEHILPILHGEGRNGKGTIVRMLKTVLGQDYFVNVASGFTADHHNEPHPERLVVLRGARIAFDQETGDRMHMNEELIKKLTGGDAIRARRMRENSWEFDPTHKLFLATNYPPKISGTDTGIWSRLKLIPFNVSFKGREDPMLDETLANEASGILAWMVRGCLRWQAEKLTEPPAVVHATAAYKGGQDTVGKFFEECCECSQTERVKKSQMTAAYRAWCLTHSCNPVSDTTFGLTMGKLCAGSDKRYYNGVKLL
jgi:P4 family phage/plasmid primase-like protien